MESKDSVSAPFPIVFDTVISYLKNLYSSFFSIYLGTFLKPFKKIAKHGFLRHFPGSYGIFLVYISSKFISFPFENNLCLPFLCSPVIGNTSDSRSVIFNIFFGLIQYTEEFSTHPLRKVSRAFCIFFFLARVWAHPQDFTFGKFLASTTNSFLQLHLHSQK